MWDHPKSLFWKIYQKSKTKQTEYSVGDLDINFVCVCVCVCVWFKSTLLLWSFFDWWGFFVCLFGHQLFVKQFPLKYCHQIKSPI